MLDPQFCSIKVNDEPCAAAFVQDYSAYEIRLELPQQAESVLGNLMTDLRCVAIVCRVLVSQRSLPYIRSLASTLRSCRFFFPSLGVPICTFGCSSQHRVRVQIRAGWKKARYVLLSATAADSSKRLIASSSAESGTGNTLALFTLYVLNPLGPFNRL